MATSPTVRGAWRGKAVACLLLAWGSVVPSAAQDQPAAEPQGGNESGEAVANADGESSANAAPAPRPPHHDPRSTTPGWLNDRRIMVEHGVGALIESFDRLFGEDRLLGLESPSSRFALKSFVRTAGDRTISAGGAVSAALELPRLERWLGNARLVVVGERVSPSAPSPPIGKEPVNDDPVPIPPGGLAASEANRPRGRTELRFDLVRHGVLIVDTGAGINFVWPPVPFARLRAHVRFGLGSGYVFRATEMLFEELGGRGAGTNTDLLVERFVGTTLRLRWELHGLFAQHTRGLEASSLVGAGWKVRPRTGLFAGVGCGAFGRPRPTLETCRIWNGVRQDVWTGWVFLELEPELSWTRFPGPTRQVPAITLRLELLIDASAPRRGAAP
jgi:hypothetical protein